MKRDLDDSRPSRAERYELATSTSDMTVRDSDLPPGAPEILVASAWGQSRVGAALLRLQGQWASASKHSPLGDRINALRELPAVRDQLTQQATIWAMPNPADLACDVLRWWLDQTCQKCAGTKYQLIPGTNGHSSVVCASCRGSGRRDLPHGQDGRKLANWLDSCRGRGRQAIGNALRGRR